MSTGVGMSSGTTVAGSVGTMVFVTRETNASKELREPS